MYEREILEELKKMNQKLDRLEELFCDEKIYGGMNFKDCLTRIMYGVD